MITITSVVYLVRHGETAWSLSGQHTGHTDIPLTENGELEAERLRRPLSRLKLAKVYTSPLRRAVQTCELAGFRTDAEVSHDLIEWNYGDYEGLKTSEIHSRDPGWQIFRDGCPGGETPDQAAARADRFLERILRIDGEVLVFSSGHILRMIAARWLELPAAAGRYFTLKTASISELGYEGATSLPVIRRWNDTNHATE